MADGARARIGPLTYLVNGESRLMATPSRPRVTSVKLQYEPRHIIRTSRRSLFTFSAATALSACALPTRLSAVPRGRTFQATVLGLPNARFFPSQDIAPYQREVLGVMLAGRVRRGITAPTWAVPLNLLAVSGGGEKGAFGAGLLCGWTEHGDRPVFDMVTGVSTGALTAPFAFLGSSYDAQLRDVYTRITARDVLAPRFLIPALFDDALAGSLPLYRTISRHLNKMMLVDLARAYRDGRLLFIGTTDLDAQVPVIWNIGAIAASGHPGALDLVRRILLASAAVPGAFPPVMINVSLGGEHYQEMHVDGGAVAQAFLYPPGLTRNRRERIARQQPVAPMNAYLIRNAKLGPHWDSVGRRTLTIAGRAISTMITSMGINDMLRIYATVRRDHVGFNLAFIPSDFEREPKAPFDHDYMQALFDYGFQQGRAGYHWAKKPPGPVGAVPVAIKAK